MYVHRKTKINLACDKSVAITNPGFSYDGEKESFEYVSVIVTMFVKEYNIHNILIKYATILLAR